MVQLKECLVCGVRFTGRVDSTCCSYRCGKKRANDRYKEKSRHGGNKEVLSAMFGFVCSSCGKRGDSFDIVSHHTTFDNTEHDKQTLMCRSCHARVHYSGKQLKPISRETMIEALENSETTQEAAAKLGLSKATMYQKRKMYGLRITKERKHITFEQFKNALEKTRTSKEAMKMLGIASTETYFRRKRAFGFMD